MFARIYISLMYIISLAKAKAYSIVHIYSYISVTIQRNLRDHTLDNHECASANLHFLIGGV